MKHFILLIIVVLNVWDAKNQHVYMNDEISSALTASPATSVASKITFVGWTVMMKMMVARDECVTTGCHSSHDAASPNNNVQQRVYRHRLLGKTFHTSATPLQDSLYRR